MKQQHDNTSEKVIEVKVRRHPGKRIILKLPVLVGLCTVLHLWWYGGPVLCTVRALQHWRWCAIRRHAPCKQNIRRVRILSFQHIIVLPTSLSVR